MILLDCLFFATCTVINLLYVDAEVPLFLDSKASRMIQLADLVAYSIYRNYEHKDSQFFELFAARFDRVGKNVHGLCEILKPYKQ